jgi:hypothetical protein
MVAHHLAVAALYERRNSNGDNNPAVIDRRYRVEPYMF